MKLNDKFDPDEYQDQVLTNFKKEDLELYQQAIVFDQDLYIKMNDAKDIKGRPVNCYHTLMIISNPKTKDKSYFWKIFREMEKRKHEGEEFWMILDQVEFPLAKPIRIIKLQNDMFQNGRYYYI